jgi:hypothetical protein
VAHFNAED